MGDETASRLKVQCQTCKKSFGGTFEKLNGTPKCPKCGAAGDWWSPVETRIIQRQRIQASREGQAKWTPPAAPGGRKWVPREEAPASWLVLRMAIAGVVLSPLGLITGPIGIYIAIEDEKRAAEGVKRTDVPAALGIILCLLSMLVSLYGCYILWAIFIDGQPVSNFR